MRVIVAALGNLLFILGGGGLLVLGAGAVPRGLLSPQPTPPAFYGTSWRSFEDVDAAAPFFVTPSESTGGRDGLAGDGTTGQIGAPGALPPGESTAVASEPGLPREVTSPPGGDPAAEGESGLSPLEGPTAVPIPTRTPMPTRTPSPAVKPVALPALQSQFPITKLRISRIRLDSGVVPAQLVSQFGATTWEVPAFRVGHGLHTAGAGEPGNSVLVGHVSSLSGGNVFRDLERVRVGDVIEVFSAERGFDYVATEVRRSLRTDLSILEPTSSPAVTLITCVGEWLPDIQDYSERVVVRATLVAVRPTETATVTATPTASATPTATAPAAETTETPVAVPAAVPATPTATTLPPSATPTVTATPTATPTPTPPPSATPTATRTATATATSTPRR